MSRSGVFVFKSTLVFIMLMAILLPGGSPVSAETGGNGFGGLFGETVYEGGREGSDGPVVLRSRFVNVDFALVGGTDGAPGGSPGAAETLLLNLFDDAVFSAVLDRLELNPSGSLSWVGHLKGIEYSQVTLVVKGGKMVGNVTLPGALYQVRHVRGSVHAILQIDQSSFPPETEPVPVLIPEDGGSLDRQKEGDDGTVVDVLVVYTPSALARAGSLDAMEALIDLAASETNTGYGNSGITQRIRVVHMEQVEYSEVNFNWSNTLNCLQNPSDGYMDNVHLLRDQYLADEVVLIVADTASCGIAYVMVTESAMFADYAFAVVSADCATGYFSFGHEMGHNMGAQHDRYAQPDPGAFDYSHGYVNTANRWRTIMAYNNQCTDNGFSCTRIQYWSNPDRTRDGAPMGVPEGSAESADNTKTLNNTALTVANFRDSENPPDTEWGTAYKALLDAPYELALLRQYRDDYLSRSYEGKVYTDVLYKNSGEALRVLLMNPGLMSTARDLLQENRGSVWNVLNGNKAVIMNTDRIIGFLDEFAANSPPELRILAGVIKREMFSKRRQGEPFLGFELK